jgi:hypothetical protein
VRRSESTNGLGRRAQPLQFPRLSCCSCGVFPASEPNGLCVYCSVFWTFSVCADVKSVEARYERK